MKIFKYFICLFALSTILISCEKKSKAEKAFDNFTEKTTEAAEDVKEATEESGKEVQKEGKKTKKKLKKIFN